LHEIGQIQSEDYREDGIYLEVNLAARDRHYIEDYIQKGENH